MAEKEYIVTVREGVDWREIHDELTRDTTTDASVDSNIVPDRECHCCKLRPTNNRNTHYHFTEQEAIALRNDPRIQAVELALKPKARAYQDGEFNRTSTSTGQQDNWGLLRHISSNNNFGSSTTDPGGTYDYVLDGTGVDVVIMDSGIQIGHPEFNDANGSSRIQQIDWFQASGVPGTMPVNHYRDVGGHGTHVAGTVAGKNFGWAKNAHIYSQKILDDTNVMSVADAFDTLLAWHNAKTNGRPTVLNMSWGYVVYLYTGTVPNELGFTPGAGWEAWDISGGVYRGVAHTDTQYSNLRTYGINGEYQGGNYYGFPIGSTSTDADIQALVNAGIIVCISAGNDSMKIDVPGGLDYDNRLSSVAGSLYYHRGGSPSVGTNPGFMVGSMSSTNSNVALNEKASYSQSGPGVDLYTAGTYISSAQPSGLGSTYYYDSNWRQAKYSGTSMASPQMAGMCALLMQAHPDWTPAQVKNWFISHATSTMYSTGTDNDYQVTNSLHGGSALAAYFPMNGQKPFSIG